MTQSTFEILRIYQLLTEVWPEAFINIENLVRYQAALHIASNRYIMKEPSILNLIIILSVRKYEGIWFLWKLESN